MSEAPKVMLHPVSSVRLRTVREHIVSNVGGRMGWRRLVQALRESGDTRPDEDIEAFVIDDDGIQIYYKRKVG